MTLAPITSGTVPVLLDAELNGQSEVPTLESSTGDYESTVPAYPGEDTRPTSEKELRA
ncbi:hypothetical protein FRC08_002515, partial [Ceratobasidium sp. 394]